MIDTARAEPVLIERYGRGVVMVISVEEYQRLSARPERAETVTPRARETANLANEAFPHVKIDKLLKDASWPISDGRSVRFEYLLDDGGKADYALFGRQDRALAMYHP